MPTVRACNHGCRSNSFRTHQLRVKFDIPVIAEPLGEAGNRGARSRNAFICMYIYIYIYISVPVNYYRLDRLRNRQDGAAD